MAQRIAKCLESLEPERSGRIKENNRFLGLEIEWNSIKLWLTKKEIGWDI